MMAFMGLFSMTTKAIANNAISDTSYIKLDSIVVKNRISIKHKQLLPYSITQVLTEDLKLGNFRTTPEALIGGSGVFIQKTNHGGGAPFIRGLTGNQTLLLIDGIRINNATFRYGPNQYLNNIDLFTIEQIDVFKGTGSVEYGSDAIGGAIHLQSILPNYATKSSWKAKMLLKYVGQDMEKTTRSSIQYAQKNMAIQIGLTSRNFGDLVGGKNVGVQTPSGYTETGLDSKLRIKIADNSEIIFSSQVLIQKNVPIYHKVLLENFKINQIAWQEKQIHAIKWIKQTNNKYFSKIQVTQSFQHAKEERESNKLNSSSFKFEKDEVNTLGTSVDILSNPNKQWHINSGIDYYADAISSLLTDRNLTTGILVNKRGLYPDQSKYNSFSVFHLHKFDLNKWHFEGGLRWNKFKIQLFDSSIGAVELQPSALVGNGGVSYKINKTSQIFSSISSGYRAPNIDDLGTLGIVDFRYEVPTKNLAPEKSVHYELGYKYYTKGIQFGVSGFYLNLKDIITRQKVTGSYINGYQVYSKQNADKSYIYGFETNLQYTINSALCWSSNLTYTYGQNRTRHEPMRRIPPMFGQQMLVWKNQKTQVQLSHQFAGKQDRLAQGDKDDNRIGPNGTPKWNVFNLNYQHQFDHLSIQIGGINLLNEKYKTHGSGIYGMGRTYSLQLSMNL